MNYFRKLAIIAGVLWIIYDAVDFLSFPFTGSITSTNYLVSVSENAGLVGTGALLLFIGGPCAFAGRISAKKSIYRHWNRVPGRLLIHQLLEKRGLGH